MAFATFDLFAGQSALAVARAFELGDEHGFFELRYGAENLPDQDVLSETGYRLNQLRYDLRKFKGHHLLERDGSRYAYRLTTKGVQVALLFLFFHKRLCGPLANSRFHHQPDA